MPRSAFRCVSAGVLLHFLHPMKCLAILSLRFAAIGPAHWFLKPEWVMVWITTVYVLIALWTLFAIRDQAGATERSVALARESADAAKTSADIAIGVSVPTLVVHELGAGDMRAASVEAFFQRPKIKITIKNYGQTPAFLKWWSLCFSCEDLPEIPTYDGPATGMILDKLVVQPNAICTLPELFYLHRQEFSIEDVKAIVKREKTFRVYGYICYGDIFGNPLRRLKFCETVLNIFGDESICDWWEGFAPPAYTGIEKFPLGEPKQERPKKPNQNTTLLD